MKAQVSVEYILIFAFSILVVGILWLSSSSSISDTQGDLQIAYAKNAADKIVQAADIAYVQGSPTQIYINVDFPDNVNAVTISGKEVSIEIAWKGFLRNISASGAANLTGYINPAAGRHRLLVRAGALVNISES